MNTRAPIWKAAVITTPEAEDAVTELLSRLFQQPASSYTDVETSEVTVAVYLSESALQHRPVRESAGPPALLQPPKKRNPRTASTQSAAALRDGLRKIQACGLKLGSGKISIQKIRREDWAESWKRHFKPIEIGSALLIQPSWSRRRPKNDQKVIVLDPGLSFGTGQHPTTRFCLQQLAAGSPPIPRHSSLSFLDIGTGSGILAIAAAKLGYAPVDAFDFDSEAVRIARENARKNHVARQVKLTRADVTKLPARPRRQYHVICANLISTLLVDERSRILSRLKPQGLLVVAGILKSEFSIVQKAFERAGLRLIASRAENEWRSASFTYRRQKD
jgi:ribosomal protein L11 methyltransferase